MIVYYVTAHGFGHAVRACEVMRHLPPDVPLTVRSEVPEWLLRSELGGRPFELIPARFDCGTLGPDSTSVDLKMTIDTAEPLLDANDQRLDAERTLLRRLGARVVVADAPSFPLRAAREAGAASVLIANFTWSAIYGHLLETEQPDAGLAGRARRVIERMQAEYDMGDLLLVPGLDVPLRACRERCDIPLIARRGQRRRDELARELGLDPTRPILLVYLGTEGRRGVDWEAVAAMRIAGGPPQLVGYRAPEGAAGLILPLPTGMHHADATASVDAVITKPGYSTAAECLAGGTPVLFTPRPQFAEGTAIERALVEAGIGLCIPEADFLAGEWQPWVDRVLALGRAANPTDGSGGRVAAETILSFAR